MKSNQVITKGEQEWLDHCAEMKRLFDLKVTELLAAGYRKVGGTKRNPQLIKGGQKFEIRRQLGSNVWYPVAI